MSPLDLRLPRRWLDLDPLAAAQLMLVLLARARQDGMRTVEEVLVLAGRIRA